MCLVKKAETKGGSSNFVRRNFIQGSFIVTNNKIIEYIKVIEQKKI